jgi:hypothetical protein
MEQSPGNLANTWLAAIITPGFSPANRGWCSGTLNGVAPTEVPDRRSGPPCRFRRQSRSHYLRSSCP